MFGLLKSKIKLKIKM